MILNYTELGNEFRTTRMAAIGGSLGAGKTLFVHDLVEPLLRRGYKYVTNYRCAWADNPLDVLPDEYGARHAVVVVDEGGIYLRKYRDVARLSMIARKLDIYLVFAGRKLPHKDLCELTIYPWIDLWSQFLLPVKVWKGVVDASKQYAFYIFQALWWQHYGLYSTLDPGAPADAILRVVDDWTRYYFSRWGYDLSSLAAAIEALSVGGDDAASVDTSKAASTPVIPLLGRKGKG